MKAYAQIIAARDADRENLIWDHIEMARRIALRVARRVPQWMSRDDILAAAMVGLVEAADRFDASRGEPFPAFAVKRVRGAVLDQLRRGDMMPRRVRQKARQVGQTIRGLEHKLGRAPEDEEIAAELNVSVEEYRESLEELVHVRVVEMPQNGFAHRAQSPFENPDDALDKKDMVRRVKECLEKLPERDALVLSLYYNEELNYAEIGDVLGVSESRVCQLHSRALARLRAEIEAQDNILEEEKEA